GQGRTSGDARAGRRTAAQCHVPRETRKQPRGARPHGGQDAQEPHPRARRRRSARRAHPVRSDQGSDYLPFQI
ncbi:MAG: Translation initiation factor 1, partial [uncultured Sphingosinicella sp.]